MRRRLDWQRVARAHVHPLALAILDELDHAHEGRPKSPKMLAAKIAAPLPNVAYHVQQLAARDLIELRHVSEGDGRRGAVEHFYGLAPRRRTRRATDAP